MDYDFVIWTGDNLPHDEWAYTPDESRERIAILTDLMKKYIKTPVYAVPGNHDCFPMDEFKYGH